MGLVTKPPVGSRIDPGHPLSKGLVGFWIMDEGGGNSVRDISGKGSPGSLTNGPSWVSSKFGKTVNLDGTDDHILVGDKSHLKFTGAFSCSAWIYPRTYGGDNTARIIDKRGSSSTGYLISVNNDVSTNAILVAVNAASGSGNDAQFFPNIINLNIWQHVLVSYDGTNVTVYVNGVSSGAKLLATPTTGTASFAIGGRTTDNLRNFDGMIDNLRVFNRALPLSSARELFASPFVGTFSSYNLVSKAEVLSSTNINVTPTAQALSLSQIASVVGGSGSTSPSSQSLTLSSPSVSINGAANIQQTVQTLSTSVGVPSVSGTGQVQAPAQAVSLSLPSVSISGTSSVSASAVSLSLAQASVSIAGSSSVLPTNQTIAVTQTSPTVNTSGSVSVDVSSIPLSLSIPSAGVTGNCSVANTAISATVGLASPSFSIDSNITQTAIPLSLVLQSLTVTGNSDGSFSPSSLQLSLGLNEPSLSGLDINIYPSYLSLNSTQISGLTVEIENLGYWLNRVNTDSGGWENRRVTSAPHPIGGGNSSFSITSLFPGGVIFWRPRYVRFGDIYAGPGEWSTRATGTTSWARR